MVETRAFFHGLIGHLLISFGEVCVQVLCPFLKWFVFCCRIVLVAFCTCAVSQGTAYPKSSSVPTLSVLPGLDHACSMKPVIGDSTFWNKLSIFCVIRNSALCCYLICMTYFVCMCSFLWEPHGDRDQICSFHSQVLGED